jgi:nitrate reductase cytochrome c-type subunit
MFKRVTIVALVVAAFLLMVAVPAMAFNGYRGDYTTTPACQTCHSGTAGIPNVFDRWAGTKHAQDSEGPSAAQSLPYGSVCAGCHTSNYAPGPDSTGVTKVTPVPTATSTKGAVSWAASPSTAAEAEQTTGNSAFSETYIGCSSCHYGANVAGGLAIYGADSNDTAHKAPYGEMANADICGACHSRYSYTVNTIAVQPVPYLTVTTPLPGTPVTPNPSATTQIQPQMAIGYPMLGAPASPPATGWNPAAPLSTTLNIPTSGWTPTPTATVGGLGKLQTYWQLPDTTVTSAVGGQAVINTLWQQTGHDGSASQYPEWANEGHANALNVLTSQAFWQFLSESDKQSCLECHSADFRILKEAGKWDRKNPDGTPMYTSADVKYGVTCVGCHTPHDSGSARGVWNGEFDDQVTVDPANGSVTNGSNLCVECHNGEIPAGTTASPGAEVHHPMKEMMDGYGAIDVAAFPSVHKGKCIQCHMPPTSVSRGSVQLGGNHTFTIITPQDANDALPIPMATTTTAPTATPTPAGSATAVATTTVTITRDGMPFSACSTCHNNNNSIKSNPVPVSTTFATANPTASPLAVTATVVQDANGTAVGNMVGGDKALWLQDTIDQRQSWTKAKIAEIHTQLNMAAQRLGYADESAAQQALVAKAEADRTTAETSFLKAFTNVGYVESEGSFGLHNWDYSRQIVNTALFQARSVEAQPAPAPWSVTFRASRTSVKRGATVSFTSTVAPADALAFGHATITIQRNQRNVWSSWKRLVLRADGSLSNFRVKMTTRGTFKLRVVMPAFLAHNMLQGISPTVTVRVR